MKRLNRRFFRSGSLTRTRALRFKSLIGDFHPGDFRIDDISPRMGLEVIARSVSHLGSDAFEQANALNERWLFCRYK